MYITTTILFIYLLVMMIYCLKAKQTLYLLSAIILCSVASVLSAHFLAEFTKINLLGLYIMPLFFCIGSIFYFFQACSLTFDRKSFSITLESDENIFLGSLTFANLFVQLGFALLVSVVYLVYPSHVQHYFLPNIFSQYVLQPIWIIGLQLTITGLIFLYTRLNLKKKIQLGMTVMIFFCSMVALAATVKICIPLLIQFSAR